MKPVDIAFTLGSEHFSLRHPRAGWPSWFEAVAVPGVSKKPDGKCTFSITIPLAGRLAPNQSWEEIRGHKALVQTDAATGKRSVVLSMAPKAVIRVFEAVIDPGTESIEVQYEISPAAITIPPDCYFWGESSNA